ncbi:hypothetical protein NCAS_0J01480 [Naumovozyma castellii]|uniref:Uncharacterized protein n=1 Tax=Naumovozyma castellii TaxID=27288 RepID=G0VKT9_NAUCA|nr:hypothetical protein NCAS_0J01480 [Naumovozyma castellii CBS 4309]CCC72127.1 hypothetical protein NCAS_0J01480 [Naumovozyma castellii CBS 4309]
MGRVRGFSVFSVTIVSIASVYMGMNFFRPIVVEQLAKDGNLREDVAQQVAQEKKLEQERELQLQKLQQLQQQQQQDIDPDVDVLLREESS